MQKQEQWLFDFGMRLKNEREKQGLTQSTLAKKSNTKPDYIAQIERGSRNPSLRTFINVLSALDVSADYLIFDATEEGTEEMQIILRDITSFISRRNTKEAGKYYEMIRFMSKYIDDEPLL